MPFTNGKAAHIRARWIEGEALRQLRFGLTYRQIAAVLTSLARGEMTPAAAGIEPPSEVTFPPGYSINHQRIFELVRQALDRYPMLGGRRAPQALAATLRGILGALAAGDAQGQPAGDRSRDTY
jgi:hypothetical protein